MRPPAPPPARDHQPTDPSPEIEGAMVAITEAGIVGWAWCPARPDQPVSVVIQAGGIAVGRARADRFDDAIAGAHGRPGVPGFCARLSRLPGGIYPMTLTLHEDDPAPSAGAGHQIGGPFVVPTIADLIPVTDPIAPHYEGSIDELRAGVINGWARDAAMPDWPVSVELLDNDRPSGRTRADLPRDDLVAAGKGTGRHGFRLPLSASLLDGQAHRLRLRIAGSKFELPNGPIVLGSLDAGDPMVAISELRQDVRRLIERVDALVDPSGLMITDLVRRLSERMAALAELHRESVERELHALRRFAFRQNEPPA